MARIALFAALLTILSGAVVTSTSSGNTIHIVLGSLFAAVTLALALQVRTVLAWGLLALVLAEAIPEPPLVHAILAQLIFGIAVFIAHTARPCLPEAASIRRFALAIPPLVLLQTALGAAYRHKVLGVLPHIGGAMIVVLFMLLVCVIILQRIHTPGPLLSAAIALMTVVLAQISLGIAAFLMRLLDADQGLAFAWITVAHVTTGALTLGASVILARQFGNEAPFDHEWDLASQSTRSSGPST